MSTQDLSGVSISFISKKATPTTRSSLADDVVALVCLMNQ
jgi:hypothetical protein